MAATATWVVGTATATAVVDAATAVLAAGAAIWAAYRLWRRRAAAAAARAAAAAAEARARERAYICALALLPQADWDEKVGAVARKRLGKEQAEVRRYVSLVYHIAAAKYRPVELA